MTQTAQNSDQILQAIQAQLGERVCASKSIGCTGCNPCQGCSVLFAQAVVNHAMVAAQMTMQQATTFYQTFWQKVDEARAQVQRAIEQARQVQAQTLQQMSMQGFAPQPSAQPATQSVQPAPIPQAQPQAGPLPAVAVVADHPPVTIGNVMDTNGAVSRTKKNAKETQAPGDVPVK